jgi:antitoxin ParD1/3/4
MSTRNVSLTEPLDRFIDERVRTGDYQNASEVVRAALRLLKQRSEDDQRALERLRAAIDEGVADIAAGRFEVVDDLAGWFDQLEAEVETAARASAE